MAGLSISAAKAVGTLIFHRVMSQVDLSTFFLSISSAAYMSMGVKPPGAPLDVKFDLDVARQNIDLLELLEEKTRGNRTADEDQLIQMLLFQLRMNYLEVSKKN
jgi:hypothetical protein